MARRDRPDGTIRIARKLYDGSDPVFGGEEFSKRDAWIWLIYAASYRDGHTRTVNGTTVTLDRGELIASVRYLAERWKWHRSRVERFLNTLQEHDRLEHVRQVQNVGTVYRLPTYERWQASRRDITDGETPSETPTETPSSPEPQERQGAGETPTEPPSEPTKKEVKKEVRGTDTSLGDKSPRSVSAGAREALRGVADADQEGRATKALVAAWIELQPERPSEAEIRKQGAVAKRLAERHEPRRLALALYGMAKLFPYSKGAPWDLFDFERKFSKAAAKGIQAWKGTDPETIEGRIQQRAERTSLRLRQEGDDD